MNDYICLFGFLFILGILLILMYLDEFEDIPQINCLRIDYKDYVKLGAVFPEGKGDEKLIELAREKEFGCSILKSNEDKLFIFTTYPKDFFFFIKYPFLKYRFKKVMRELFISSF